MSEIFSNGLTDAQLERLAVLSEELGEVQQVIGKIIRHGYESCDPTGKVIGDNRSLLEKELGDLDYIGGLMTRCGDISAHKVILSSGEKWTKIKPYLHHQETA